MILLSSRARKIFEPREKTANLLAKRDLISLVLVKELNAFHGEELWASPCILSARFLA
jgi:hypothetical protein